VTVRGGDGREIEGGHITWITRAHDEAADAFKEVRRERLV